MNFDINLWMKEYSSELRKKFGNRIWFVGLQGSYGRNEATEQSDIDAVVILDKVTLEDIKTVCRIEKRHVALSQENRNCLIGKNPIYFNFIMTLFLLSVP